MAQNGFHCFKKDLIWEVGGATLICRTDIARTQAAHRGRTGIG